MSPRSSALAAIHRPPNFVKIHIRQDSISQPEAPGGLEAPQTRSILPAELIAKYSKKVGQRGVVAMVAMWGLCAFVAFQISVFFFDVSSPLHVSFFPSLLATLQPQQRQKLVASLARNNLLPEDLASEDPYLIQRGFLIGKSLLFPILVHAADASQAAALVKLGFGGVEISDHGEIFGELAKEDLTKHALVGFRTKPVSDQEITDLLEIYHWVTVDLTKYAAADITQFLNTRKFGPGNLFLRIDVEGSEDLVREISDHKIAGLCLARPALAESWGKLARDAGSNFRVVAPIPASGRVTGLFSTGAHAVMAEEITDFRVARRAKTELTNSLIGGGFYDIHALSGSRWRELSSRERETDRRRKQF